MGEVSLEVRNFSQLTFAMLHSSKSTGVLYLSVE